MVPELALLLVRHHGVISWRSARAVVPRHILDDTAARGEIVRLAPGVFADAGLADEPSIRLRAAVVYARGQCAVSHTSGLRLWKLLEAYDDVIHLTVDPTCRLRGASGFVRFHRREGFVAPAWRMEERGLPTRRLEHCLVDSWPLLPVATRREPVIAAVQRRMTSPSRIRSALDGRRPPAGAAELRHLLGLLEGGSHSELEIWGFEHVFDHPDLPRATRQLAVRVSGRRFVLDLGYADVKVGVELDGAAYHSAPDRRAADVERDRLLAMAGWVILRFTYWQVRNDPVGVRRQLAAVIAARRQQLLG